MGGQLCTIERNFESIFKLPGMLKVTLKFALELLFLAGLGARFACHSNIIGG